MRGDAVEPFEHLVAGNFETPLAREQIGQNRRPDRMCVQHRACAGNTDDRDVEQRLRGWLTLLGPHRRSIGADFENLVWREAALIQGARGDGHAKRVAIDDGAEIPARS